VYVLIAGRPLRSNQRAAVQASNLETVREFGSEQCGVLVRLIVSNGANVLGRQKDCQAHVSCRATDSEESKKRIKSSISSKSRRVEFRGESLECQLDQMKAMPRKDRVSTLSDVAERA
jgi:hypothetical protein